MQLGVEKCIEVIKGFGELGADTVAVVKSGGLAIGKYLEIGSDIVEIARDIPGALPEVRDLDREEIGMLIAALWEAAQRVITEAVPGAERAQVERVLAKAAKQIAVVAAA